MSNTAVLFNALQPLPQRTTSPPSHHHHHHHHHHHRNTAATTTTTTVSDSFNQMYQKQPHSSSPNRRRHHHHRDTTRTTNNSLTSVMTTTTSKMNDDRSIRRGAEIVRQQIQQQQYTANSSSSFVSSSSSYRMQPSPPRSSGSSSMLQQQQQQQPSQSLGYDVDDIEILLPDDSTDDDDEEVTTEDHISVTSWSEYDVLPSYLDFTKKKNHSCNSKVSIEVDPPSVADWSIDGGDDIDDDTTSHHSDTGPVYNTTTTTNVVDITQQQFGGNFTTTTRKYNQTSPRNTQQQQQQQQQPTIPPPIANYNNTTMLFMTQNENLHSKIPTTTDGGFISSDDDDEDDDNDEDHDEDKQKQKNPYENSADDDDDDSSTSDIVEINDNSNLFDPFHAPSSSSSSPSNKISTKLLSSSTNSTPLTLNPTSTEERSPRNSIDTTNGEGGSKSSGGSDDNSPHLHRTVALSSSPNGGIRKGYPLPFHIQESTTTTTTPQPNFKNSNHHTNNNNNNNNMMIRNRKGNGTRTPLESTNTRSSLFEDIDIDAYCGYNNNNDTMVDNYGGGYQVDEQYDSPPEKPVREVPIHTPSTVSNLSSPGMVSKKSSAIMIQYDQLLRDPAYLHAQNAGFIWQSIVGQHIRFPSTWWNGARGPPINTGYENPNNRYTLTTDVNHIPWMYFGRHTIADHPILNQLVKCRASAGRLLLHIVVQDLMTRTPIQDIVIGCFHPNSKGIRSPNSPALKRYENCRDIWMAVRKRNHTAVAATDSLIYSPNHWEIPNPTGNTRLSKTSAYNYSICRSPLGSGLRVTNQNVRAVFGDKAPLETIFLSEDELYERLAARIMIQQQNLAFMSSSNGNKSNIKSKSNSTAVVAASTQNNELSPPLAILQELVFA